MMLFGMRIPDKEWDAGDAALLSFVSEQRKNKCMRYRFDSDKKLSLYSVLLLKMKMSELLGVPLESLSYSVNAYGKPVLRFPQSVPFNFSHSASFVLCGIREKNEIGVDTQKIENPPYAIMEHCFHPSERQAVMNTAIQDRKTRFYEIWTRKEAYFKWKGTGLLNQINRCNMIDPEREKFFYSWKWMDYMCSVYSENSTFPQMEEIVFDDLVIFYRNRRCKIN